MQDEVELKFKPHTIDQVCVSLVYVCVSVVYVCVSLAYHAVWNGNICLCTELFPMA